MGRSCGLLQSRAPGRKGGETEEGPWVLGQVCVSELWVLRYEPLAVTSSTSGCSRGVLVVMG